MTQTNWGDWSQEDDNPEESTEKEHNSTDGAEEPVVQSEAGYNESYSLYNPRAPGAKPEPQNPKSCPFCFAPPAAFSETKSGDTGCNVCSSTVPVGCEWYEKGDKISDLRWALRMYWDKERPS